MDNFFLVVAAYLLIGVGTVGWFMYGMTKPKTGEYLTVIFVWLFWPLVLIFTLLAKLRRKTGE